MIVDPDKIPNNVTAAAREAFSSYQGETGWPTAIAAALEALFDERPVQVWTSNFGGTPFHMSTLMYVRGEDVLDRILARPDEIDIG